jgi:hypothetical protein
MNPMHPAGEPITTRRTRLPGCGAKRRDGGSCASPAMEKRPLPDARRQEHRPANTRRTRAGAQGALGHGYYSAEAKAARVEGQQAVRELRALLALP